MNEARALTLDEVCGTYDEAPVWIQTISTAVPMIALYCREHYPSLYFQRPIGETKYHIYSYGKSWRCWNIKPSIEQMNAIPWADIENAMLVSSIRTIAGRTFGYCPACGRGLDSYHDGSSGDHITHYCYNCGQAVKWE